MQRQRCDALPVMHYMCPLALTHAHTSLHIHLNHAYIGDQGRGLTKECHVAYMCQATYMCHVTYMCH